MREAVVTEVFGRDNGDDGDFAREFVLKNFVLSPGIDAVKDDALLTGGDEIFGLGDGLASDPIFTFGATNFFAEFALSFRSDFETAFFHFLIE